MNDRAAGLTWDTYVGQESLKKRLKISILSAKRRGERLDHVLLESGMPGVGKTTMARLIAGELGVHLEELVPPFKAEDVANISERLDDGDVLFIDEVHKLADSGKRGTEIMLKLLEDGTVQVGGETIQLPNVTIICATTDADKLPETVLDRFKIRPHFDRYTLENMEAITGVFATRHGVKFSKPLTRTIASASRFTPRVIEGFILAARDLEAVNEAEPTPEELLEFEGCTRDGLTLQHQAYLTSLLEQKRHRRGELVCEAGETLLCNLLRETRPGVQRLERYLMELGYVERTNSGRALTREGIARAQELVGGE